MKRDQATTFVHDDFVRMTQRTFNKTTVAKQAAIISQVSTSRLPNIKSENMTVLLFLKSISCLNRLFKRKKCIENNNEGKKKKKIDEY